MNGFVCVQTFLGRMEAESVRLALESAGIPVIILADDAGGVRPELSMHKGVRLMVREQDEVCARDILREGLSTTIQEPAEAEADIPPETSSSGVEAPRHGRGVLSRLRRWLTGA